MKKYGGVAAAPPGAFVGPCFHGNLMRTIELTNEAVGTVNDDIANRQPLTPADLASAWVPSLCEHKAGT